VEIPDEYIPTRLGAATQRPVLDLSRGIQPIGATFAIGGYTLPKVFLSKMAEVIGAVAKGKYTRVFDVWDLPEAMTWEAANNYCQRIFDGEVPASRMRLPVEVGFWLYYSHNTLMTSPLITGEYNGLDATTERERLEAKGIQPIGFFHTHNEGISLLPSADDLKVGISYDQFLTVIGTTYLQRPLVAIAIPKRRMSDKEVKKIYEPLAGTYKMKRPHCQGGNIVRLLPEKGEHSPQPLHINLWMPLGPLEENGLQVLCPHYHIAYLDLGNWQVLGGCEFLPAGRGGREVPEK